MRGRAEWAIEGLTPVTENCELVIRFNHMILGSFEVTRGQFSLGT